jgi:hypothetical protein
MHQAPPTQVIVAQNDRLELHCDVSGSPPPAVYWLKNGQPIREVKSCTPSRQCLSINRLCALQAPFEVEESTNKILESGSLLPERGLASTKSRLVIDCADEDTEAIYTCVAESRSERLVSSTYAHIEGVVPYNKTTCALKEEMHALPATIFMWSGTYIDEEGQDAVLLCRAAGYPQPKITWFDRDNRIVTPSRRHQLLPTGDLKIHKLRWNDDMGGFTCRAENQFGSDETLTFLYPTMVRTGATGAATCVRINSSSNVHFFSFSA